MTNETRRLVRMIVSAFTSGIIAGGSVILGAVSGDGTVKPGTWLLAGVTCVLGICKDIQSGLSTSPIPDTPPPPLVDPRGQPVRTQP